MILLYTGVAIWAIAHFFKRLTPGLRGAMDAKMGAGPARGIMSLIIVISVVLMVVGFRAAPVDIVFETPSWGRHLNSLLMLFSVALLGLGKSGGKTARMLRHPMLVGIIVWSAAHLLVNGDLASIVLFGGMALWAVLSMLLINMQEGAWQKPEAGPIAADIKWIVISVVVYSVIAGIHHFIGPSPFGG